VVIDLFAQFLDSLGIVSHKSSPLKLDLGFGHWDFLHP
jgi:hypothetical protein